MKKLVKKNLMLLAGVLIMTNACNQVSKSDLAAGGKVGKGTVVVKLTDAPFPVSLVEKAMVTIDKIEIRATDSVVTTAGDTIKAGQFLVLSTDAQEFNLLDLRNGITADLVQMEIPAGSYDMIRMHVISSSVILTDGTQFDMKIPSGMQSGLKIKLDPDLVVENGVVNDVLVDFDVSKSFIVMGNMKSKMGIKGFMFKPVLRAMCEVHSGSIWGQVSGSDTIAIPEAHVQILRADTVFSSALAGKDGKYALIGIPAGTYQMVCEKDGYVSETVDAVVVTPREKTIQDFKLTKN